MTERRCVVCGARMEGRRRQARTCGGACRAEASRLRRLLAGEQPVDGCYSVADRLGRLDARRPAETAQSARTAPLAA
jgi:hypothetical protein